MAADRDRITFAAASMRFVLALFALFALPAVLPGVEAQTWIFVAYLAATVVVQWMIWKDVGGRWRPTVYGLVDIGMITFLVHHAGSAATALAALYVFAAVMNTVFVGERVGLLLAAVAALAYAGLVTAEVSGVLPYGPSAPPWVAGPPTPLQAACQILMMSVLLLASAAVVGAIVRQSQARQAELVTANRKLEELSLRDPLTQLYNRRHVMDRLEAELASVRRGRRLAVIMVDLDRFKRVNDETGHQGGDALLQELAQSLVRAVRESDVVGRYGGDEFVVLLPDADAAQAERVGARIRDEIRRVGARFDPQRPVTASVGVAIAGSGDDPRGLLQRADRASYAAKARGGDGVSLDPDHADAICAREPVAGRTS